MKLIKPTIAWDVDDVLNDLMREWLKDGWRQGHAECELRYEEVHENPPYRLLGATLSDYLSSLDAYRLSGQYAALEPLAEVFSWFTARGSFYRHVALTSVPLRCAHVSAAWVVRHYGRWIRSFHLVPSARGAEDADEYDSTKTQFLQRVGGIDVLVDDCPANIEAARRAGVKAVLFPRPWNGGTCSVAQGLMQIEESLAPKQMTTRPTKASALPAMLAESVK